MIYKNVSSREIIARIENDFNIDYSGWIHRAPQWIADCLGDIEIFPYLEPVKECLQVVDYKLKLPCNLKLLDAVKYNGVRLDRTDVINRGNSCDLANINTAVNNDLVQQTYQVDGNDWLSFTFEEGEVTLYYKQAPVDYDQVTKIYFPLVPDNQKLKMAIELYVVKSILGRGHKHVVYSLTSNLESTNPYILYKIAKAEARNSMGTMDRDARIATSLVLTEFLSNKEYRFNEQFDNSAANLT